MEVIKYSVSDLFDLNKQLNFPTNPKLITEEFKTIPGCNKSYGFKKNEKQNNLDNIKSILNKIHTSNFDKLYLKIDLNDSLEFTGLILAIFGVGYILGSFYGGKLCDSVRPFYVAIMSISGYSISVFSLYFIHKIEFIIPLIFIFGTSVSCFTPALRILFM